MKSENFWQDENHNFLVVTRFGILSTCAIQRRRYSHSWKKDTTVKFI